jgi:hypothetical protein
MMEQFPNPDGLAQAILLRWASGAHWSRDDVATLIELGRDDWAQAARQRLLPFSETASWRRLRGLGKER